MNPAVPGSITGLIPRARNAWKGLFREQRLAGVGALGLFASMFLPWYQQTGFSVSKNDTQKVENSLIAFQAWSFVEASILLVAIAILLLLFARGERRAFHLPGGDGLVVLAAGAWVMFLIFYRQIDKPNGAETGTLKTTIGVSWGIFVAFLFGALIAYAGWRIQTQHRPEPRRDGETPRVPPDIVIPQEPPTTRSPAPDTASTTQLTLPAPAPARGPRRPDGQFEGQLSFEDPDDKPAA